MNTSTTYKLLKPTKIFFAAVFAFLMVGVGSVSGTTYNWTGTTSTAWETTTNWTPNGNPGSAAGDIVQIGVTSFTGSQPTLSVTPANALASITLGTAKNATLTISDPNLCFANPNPPFVVKPLRACNL